MHPPIIIRAWKIVQVNEVKILFMDHIFLSVDFDSMIDGPPQNIDIIIGIIEDEGGFLSLSRPENSSDILDDPPGKSDWGSEEEKIQFLAIESFSNQLPRTPEPIGHLAPTRPIRETRCSRTIGLSSVRI